MSFLEERYPLTESYQSTGGPGFNTRITRLQSGAEERTGRFESALQRFDLRHGLTDELALNEVYRFFQATKGSLIPFRFLNLSDHASTLDGRTIATNGALDPSAIDQSLGVGDGSQTAFQVIKTYQKGSFTTEKPIQKLVANTLVIALDGVPTPTGWSVDITSGIITFTVAPAAGVVVTAGYEYDTPVRFGQEVDQFLPLTAEGFRSSSIQTLPLDEVRDAVQVDSLRRRGGSFSWGAITANVSTTMAFGELQLFDPQSAGLQVNLPPEANVQGLGGPYVTLANLSGTHALNVADSTGTLLSGLSSVPTNGYGYLYMRDAGSGVGEWILAP